MNAGSKSHEKVPNGMGKGNPSIHLEEYHPSNVANASQLQLVQPRYVLKGNLTLMQS
jgi:hypothetical protein